MSTTEQVQGNGQGKGRVTIRQLPTGVPGLDLAYGVGRGDLYYEPADAHLPPVTTLRAD